MVSSVVVVPPSGLPAISPTRREIRWERFFCLKLTPAWQITSRILATLLSNAEWRTRGGVRLISPLVGEMPGRAEGGNATLLNKQGGTSC